MSFHVTTEIKKRFANIKSSSNQCKFLSQLYIGCALKDNFEHLFLKSRTTNFLILFLELSSKSQLKRKTEKPLPVLLM